MAAVNSDTKDRELHISRLFNAPIELLWEVWTNPDHLKHWWGPNGFTNSISKMDVQNGGGWSMVMHGPDGTDYPNESIFIEVIKHRKIVYRHFEPSFLTTVEFEAQGEKTLMNWHMLFESREQFIQVVKEFRADEGLKQNIQRLAAYLSNFETK